MDALSGPGTPLHHIQVPDVPPVGSVCRTAPNPEVTQTHNNLDLRPGPAGQGSRRRRPCRGSRAAAAHLLALAAVTDPAAVAPVVAAVIDPGALYTWGTKRSGT